MQAVTRLRFVCVLAVLAAAAAATNHIDPSSDKVKHNGREASIYAAQLPGPDQPKPVNIMHINDVYDVRQSPRCLQKMNDLSDDQTLRLFSGDIVGPSIISDIEKGMQMVRVMQEFAFDFSVLGNHELDYSEEHFLEFNRRIEEGWKAKHRHTWLVANFKHKTGDKGTVGKAKEWGTKTIGGLKIGVFGLVDMAWIEATKIDPKQYDYEHFKAAASRVSRYLREEEKCDLVFCVSHMENKSDEELLPLVNKPGEDGNEIDFLFGGHDHIYYIKRKGEGVLLKSGMDFEQFSNLKMWFTASKLDEGLLAGGNSEKFTFLPDDNEKGSHSHEFLFSLDRTREDGKSRYLNVLITRVLVTPGDPKHPGLDEYVREKIDPLITRHLLPVLHIQSKLDTRERILFGGESPVMDLFADVGRAYYGAEVCIVNVRMLKGEKVHHSNTFMRRLDFMRLFPYHEDKYVEVDLKGSEIREVLWEAVPLIHKENKRWVGLSGITFKYSSKPLEGGRHYTEAKLDMESVRINGEPIDADRVYRAVVISSILKPKMGFKATIGKTAKTATENQKEPIEVFDYIGSIFEAKKEENLAEFDKFKTPETCGAATLNSLAVLMPDANLIAASAQKLKLTKGCTDLFVNPNVELMRRARFFSMATGVEKPDNRVVLSFKFDETGSRLVLDPKLII